MPATPRVRAATGADVDFLVEFNAAMALETEAKTLVPATLRAGVARVLADPARGFYLVAEIDDVVAGCLMITYEWSDWRNGEWWWLQSVYVRPEYRRQCVFHALFDEIEQRVARTPDALGLRLYVERNNRRAQQTYASLGMYEDHYRVYHKPLRADVREPLPDHA